ncbi:hypothetical protein MNBD_GAMMA09-3664, partial [hydrothermal vent metagenome]
FDLLAYAARYQDKTLLTDLINKALIKIHPPASLLFSSNIVPFSANVNNLGADAQIKVSMLATAGTQWTRAEGGGIINNPQVFWQGPLAENNGQDFTAWAKLPTTGGDVNIQLVIEAGQDNNSLIAQENKTLNLSVSDRPLLADITIQIEDLLAQGYLPVHSQKNLNKARHKLEKAMRYEQKSQLHHAAKAALKATDAISEETEQAIIDIRLQIDHWLRLATLRDKDHSHKNKDG